MFNNIGKVTSMIGVFIVHKIKSLNKKNCIYGSIGRVKDNDGFGKKAWIGCVLTVNGMFIDNGEAK